MGRKLLLLLLLLYYFAPVPAGCETPSKSKHHPQPCTGILPYADETKYGFIYTYPPEISTAVCPPQYGIYGNLLMGRRITNHPASVGLRASCCPLPATDILREEIQEVIDQCPENFVAVGSTQECKDCPPLLRCQSINTDRYMLGQPRPGLLWGMTSSPWKNANNAMKSDIPRAIRFGVSRAGRFDEHSTGCVGYPFGSLLTAKTGKHCNSFLFRELLFRGLAGDPPAGTPVTMYPECRNLSQNVEGDISCNE